MKVSQIKKALNLDDKELEPNGITNDDLVFRTAYATNKISPPYILKQLTQDDCAKRLDSKFIPKPTLKQADSSSYRRPTEPMQPTPANMSKKSQPTEVAPSK